MGDTAGDTAADTHTKTHKHTHTAGHSSILANAFGARLSIRYTWLIILKKFGL